MTGLSLAAAAGATSAATTALSASPTGQRVLGWVVVLLGLFLVACTIIWPVWHTADVRRGVARWRPWDLICVLPLLAWVRVLARLADHQVVATQIRQHQAGDARRAALAAAASHDPLGRPEQANAGWVPLGYGPDRTLLGSTGHTLTVGPTGCGKTRNVLAPIGFRWTTAPMIVVSTKTDLADLLAAPRSRLQPVWGWDPTGRAGLDQIPGLTAIRWDPVTEIATPDDAVYLADQMIRAAGVGTGDGGAYWASQGAVLLSALLWAAKQAGQDTGWVLDQAYAGPEAWAGLLDTIAAAPTLAAPLSGLVVSAAGDGGRRVDSTAGTVQAALAAYRLTALRDHTLPAITLSDWANRAGCLFIVCPMDQANTVAPVVVALISAAITAQRQRRNGDALLLIDELPNIAPLPDLPSWLAELRSWGLTIVGAAQAWAQLARWGPNRQALEQAWPWLALFGGITDTELVAQISKTRGDQLITRPVFTTGTSSQWHPTSGGAGPGGGVGGGRNSGTSQQHTWEPYLRPEHVVGTLRPGQLRLIHARTPCDILQTEPITQTLHAWHTGETTAGARSL